MLAPVCLSTCVSRRQQHLVLALFVLLLFGWCRCYFWWWCCFRCLASVLAIDAPRLAQGRDGGIQPLDAGAGVVAAHPDVSADLVPSSLEVDCVPALSVNTGLDQKV